MTDGATDTIERREREMTEEIEVRVHPPAATREPGRRHIVGGIGGVLLLWECAVRFGGVNATDCPAPSMIILELVRLGVTGVLWPALVASGMRWLTGMLTGCGLGVLLAVAAGRDRLLGGLTVPWVHLLYPVPKIALLPLFVLWLGIGELPKLVIIALGAFFPVFINTRHGMSRLPRRYDEVVAVYPVGTRYYVRRILLPGVYPSVFAGLKLAAGSALVLLVAAEMLAADTGIGALILQYGDLMLTASLLACVTVLAAAGLVIQYLIGCWERAVVRWR